jgi:dihydropteroate synthase
MIHPPTYTHDLPADSEKVQGNRSRCEAADFTLKIGRMSFELSRETLIMGVLNITPDSFSDGGKYLAADEAAKRAVEMAWQGAHIIDIGGESSRPGAEPISADEEARRVLPVIDMIRERIDVPISIDTYKASVARRAVDAGAGMINDISALTLDPDMAPLAAELCVPVVLMHIKGTPPDMQKNPEYEDVVGEVRDSLKGSILRALGAGIEAENIVVDPGIGFGKTADDNLMLIKHIRELYDLGRPVLIGASRKHFIGRATGKPVTDRLWGSVAAASAAALLGAHMVRVHDVAETRDALMVVDAIKRGRLLGEKDA